MPEDMSDDMPDEPVVVNGRYCTVAEVRQALRAPSDDESLSWDSGSFNNSLSRNILSAESWIDDYCDQSFDAAAEDASDLVLRIALDGQTILTGPAASAAATLTISGTELEDDSWIWCVDETGRNRIARHIELLRLRNPGPVTVSARWGWPAIPHGVKTAAINLAAHWFTLESQSGMSARPQMGYIASIPWQIKPQLLRYRSPVIV